MFLLSECIWSTFWLPCVGIHKKGFRPGNYKEQDNVVLLIYEKLHAQKLPSQTEWEGKQSVLNTKLNKAIDFIS